MKALVTGGGGFLGAAIARRLLLAGAEVSSFSRQEYPVLAELKVRQLRGDLADANAVAAAVQGSDVVFHVAAKAGVWGRFEDYYRANVLGTANVLGACRRFGVRRLVYTSSPSVVFDGRDLEGVNESLPYPDRFPAYYPQTKAEAEQMVRSAHGSALATVCLRPHLIWGPGDNHLLPRLAARSRSGQLRRIGRQKKLIDTVYIDNAAEAHLLAANRLGVDSVVGGKVYFISQGEPVETWSMINGLLEAVGAPPVERTVPVWTAKVAAWMFENLYRLGRFQGEPRLTRFVVKELCTSHWFDISAARRELGYVPGVSVAAGLSRLKAGQKVAFYA